MHIGFETKLMAYKKVLLEYVQNESLLNLRVSEERTFQSA